VRKFTQITLFLSSLTNTALTLPGVFQATPEDCGDTAVYRWVVAPCLNQWSIAESGADASLVRRDSLVQV